MYRAEEMGADDGVVQEAILEPLKWRERETTVNMAFENPLEVDGEVKVLPVDAESNLALELLDAKDIANRVSQTVLRRRRVDMLRKPNGGGYSTTKITTVNRVEVPSCDGDSREIAESHAVELNR